VFKAYRLCVSLNSRLESNKEEKRGYTQVIRPCKHSQPCQSDARGSFEDPMWIKSSLEVDSSFVQSIELGVLDLRNSSALVSI